MNSQNENQPTHPIPQEAFDWYDEYAHGLISRREFFNRLSTLTVLGFTVSALAGALIPNYALAEQVSFNDPDIKAEYETFPSPDGHGEGRGYLVVPESVTEPTGTVLVVHENRGLNPYVEDVARRVAKAGFVAFAPDALHPVGGYPGNDDEGRELQRSLDQAKIEQDMIAAIQWARANHAEGKLLLWGSSYSSALALRIAGEHPEEIDGVLAFAPGVKVVSRLPSALRRAITVSVMSGNSLA